MIPRSDQRPHVIDLNCEGQRVEGTAKDSEAIKPGMLLDLDVSSDDMPRTPEVVKKHASQGVLCMLRVALADRLRNFTLDDTYADGDNVPFVICKPGDVFLARVADDFDSTGAIGTLLCSGGNGLFEAVGGGDIALAQVEEEVDYAGDDPAATRLYVRARAL